MGHVTPTVRQRPGGHHGRACGFTLIELLVSTAIGMFILAGLIGVLRANYSSARSNDQTSELVANGGKTLDLLKRDIRQAGFLGRTWGESGVSSGWVAPSQGCAGSEPGASAGAFVSNLRQGVWGANNSNPFPGNCIPPQAYVAGTDVLVVRYLATVANPALLADAIYLRSGYGRGELFRGAQPPADTAQQAATVDFAVRIHVYHVRPYTRSPDENPRVPALVRSSLQSDAGMRTELVASGVSQFQVQYGRLKPDATVQFADALEGPSSAAGPTEWSDVHALRIWLLVQGAAPEAGYVNQLSYVMGDQTVPASMDAYHRQVFSSVVQLRNGAW